MKFLTLIRHAKSSHDSPTLRDFHRPLNERGRRDAPAMGRHLDETFRFSPDKIISSPATRTLATARIIAEAIGYDLLRIQQEESIYEAPISAILQILKEVDDEIDHVCVVGHNPGMENLTNWLVGERCVESFPTCGVAMLELNIGGWSKIRAGAAKLKEFLEPKKLWGKSRNE